MSLLDALTASTHPASSSGAANDIATGYITYNVARSTVLDPMDVESYFYLTSIESNMVIALPVGAEPVTDDAGHFAGFFSFRPPRMISAVFMPTLAWWESKEDELTLRDGDFLPPISIGEEFPEFVDIGTASNKKKGIYGVEALELGRSGKVVQLYQIVKGVS